MDFCILFKKKLYKIVVIIGVFIIIYESEYCIYICICSISV